jgi:hypothetical protein
MTITTVRKDALASIQPGEDDAAQPHGSFHIILSTAAKDRDGDQLHPQEWEQPLPERITMDVDHGMSVATTVGSGVPTIENGEMHVRGTYASIARAQEVRALVNEGHVTKTSVAFLNKTTTDGKGAKTTARELLNGAFVAVPANDEARVLASKTVKEGRRNSDSDTKAIQAIHDHAAGLGAQCPGGKAARKDAGTGEADEDPAVLAQAVDAAIDEAMTMLADIDTTALPEPVQQAIALMQGAAATVDTLLSALGAADPDDSEPTAGADDAAEAASSASAAGTAALPDRIAAARAFALGALSETYEKTGS